MNNTSTSTPLTCNGCGKLVNGGTYISNVFYCPMCTSIINKNNTERKNVYIDNVNIKDEKDLNLIDFTKQLWNITDSMKQSSENQSVCEKCSKNPKNGGDGVCHCILGSIPIKC